ncbi:ABC transporter substrate-binding protein [Faecousia sp.]|uniref:ABC transporter substrate-binding protein n=1 Tax=Faecousia sp. TaxID=2952921 RepID=UPI003AB5B2DC
MKKVGSLLLAVLMVLSLAACGKTPAEPTQTPSTQPSTETPTTEATEPAPTYAIDTLTVGTTAAIETAVFGEYNFDMLASGVSELPLVYQDTKGEYHPLLATYATEDAATWTYTIQDGLTWSDGEPVTAEDILFTLQYDQANGSANFEAQTGEDGKVTEAKYTGYSLSDDKMSISLTLASPNVRELSNMTSFRVMPKHVYEGKDTVTEAEGRITCGPYVLESFNKEAGTITFAVNEYYPQKPNVEKIVYQLFGNEDTMYLALQQGDIDMVWSYSTGVAGTYQDVLSTDTNVSLVNVAAANVPAVLAFNNAKGLFADENLRQAVSYALDYDAFKTYFGSAYAEIPNRGFVPSTTVGYTDTEKLTTDTAKADEYMKAAGYTEKNADGFYVNADGTAAAFTLTVNAAKETHVGYAEMVKTQLEAFGIQVNLDAVDKDAYNAKTSNKFSENNITMEAAIYGYTAAGMGMGNGLGSIYVDGNHAVQGGCQVFDEAFSSILDELKAAKTIEEYYTGAAKLQDYYAAHMPLIALYWDNMMLAYSSKLDNVTVDAVFGLNNVNNWFSITKK